MPDLLHYFQLLKFCFPLNQYKGIIIYFNFIPIRLMRFLVYGFMVPIWMVMVKTILQLICIKNLHLRVRLKEKDGSFTVITSLILTIIMK